MIKKILLALVVALPMCAWAQTPKFGIVDVESIIPKMTEFVEAQNKLSEASKTYETEYAKINEELQKLIYRASGTRQGSQYATINQRAPYAGYPGSR